jgi:hypothetical protein
VLIGVTDEEPEVVEKWLARAKPSYPIAITKGAFESQIGVPHFPYSAVIGPDGNIAYAGDSGMGENQLDDALAKSKKQPLWPKSLGKVTKLMMGDPIKAYGELKKLIADAKVSEAEKPYVDSFVAFLEGQAQQALEDARSLRDSGLVLKALRKVEAYSTSVTPFPSTPDCATLVKELQAFPDFKREIAGGEAYLAAEKLEKEDEYLDAFEGYKSVSKKFAGTKIADNAKFKAEKLRTDGLPGYEPNCNDCRRAKRACDKHREDVKL